MLDNKQANIITVKWFIMDSYSLLKLARWQH